MHTTFILVTHNSAKVLDTCLAALKPLDDVTILIVDNASADRVAPRGAQVIALEKNLGFAAAANIGARAAVSPLLCFLNPDCAMTSETLASARAALHHRPRACAVPDFEQNGTVVPGRQPGYSWRKVLADVMETKGRYPALAARLRSHPAHHQATWFWPLGTCLFVPADLFRDLGGFDERYFLYMEDVEFGMALRRHGGEVIGLSTRLRHGSMKSSDVDAAQRLQWLTDARVQFARRHYGPAVGLLARWLA